MTDGDWKDDPLWYKDAIIYQIHVKSFFDANDDGVGDFRGLRQKLDYIQSLGVNTVWLLPFYPSPLRDDGYDIADYRNINPTYGNRRDFRAFIREAHRRGLKVVTELVINHTSDQNPWFQAARRAPRNSAKRDFYVWSDTDKKFPETRIIFTDTETSNWAWDPVAQQYYWHRFFSHQPDLNHNNPRVVNAVIKVMRFWLDMGVDGLRLDAIPYLCVRESTDNENLPETHGVIRKIRAAVDEHYADRMLLAEANQWPEDVREYFGSGDECHMAYHFPLMPRMYMAIAQEDRHPIVEIMDQTPDIPDTCQWAIFLRNHDELTLEMVTDEERDYMYATYASDPRMRINVGIRRRLAPLMDNDIDKIRLMNSMLLSMPGSPIIYYGDELGMGDNIFLGDRNSVRTPMQWSPDRNAGFSKADPQSLYFPPIMDPIYGYEAVNVEAQSRDPSSLLNWMRRMLSIRRQRRAFGRGTLKFLRPGNRKVLVYVREWGDEKLLCVVNLARSAQPVELDLSRFKGSVPVELLGRTAFPPIGELPYLLTLPAYGFYWFDLADPDKTELPAWHESHVEEPPWVVLFEGLASFDPERVEPSRRALAGTLRDRFESEVLPRFIGQQRWFAGKGAKLGGMAIRRSDLWQGSRSSWLLTTIEAQLDGAAQRYFLPLAVAWEQEKERLSAGTPLALARVRQRSRTGLLFDAFADAGFCRELVEAVRAGQPVDLGSARLEFRSTHVLEEHTAEDLDALPVRRTSTEGSNSTLLIGNRLFLKGYRRMRSGVNPEWEMGHFLTAVSPCNCIIPVAGAVEYRAHGEEPAMIALLQSAIANQGDGWRYTQEYLARFLEQVRLTAETTAEAETETHANYLLLMRLLGARTAELHRALAVSSGDPAFEPEPIEADWLEDWRARITAEAAETRRRLLARREELDADCRSYIERCFDSETSFATHLGRTALKRVAAVKTRYHGDYHLGQVLLVENDFVITDLEGEPGRSLAERRAKHTPLKDVAGMLRSFSYAHDTALAAPTHSTGDEEPVRGLLDRWEALTRQTFLESYRETIATCRVWPEDPDDAAALIDLAALEKLLYEIRYELDNRPDWLALPLRHLAALLENEA